MTHGLLIWIIITVIYMYCWEDFSKFYLLEIFYLSINRYPESLKSILSFTFVLCFYQKKKKFFDVCNYVEYYLKQVVSKLPFTLHQMNKNCPLIFYYEIFRVIFNVLIFLANFLCTSLWYGREIHDCNSTLYVLNSQFPSCFITLTTVARVKSGK